MGFLVRRTNNGISKLVSSTPKSLLKKSIEINPKINFDKTKFVVATTDTTYFRWQMLVQINNFNKFNMLDDLIYIVAVNEKKSDGLIAIEKNTGVKICVYNDDRQDKSYTASIKPYLLKQFLKDYSECGKSFFLFDPDVIFTRPFNLDKKYFTDDVWYLSDTKSYLFSPYIKSKGEALFYEMCEIVNILPDLVIKNDNNAGGAQYLIKNVDSTFFDKVEIDSVNLFHHMENTKSTYNPEYPIQSWTAEMWSILWNAWKQDYKTLIIDELKFGWATDPVINWNYMIFHNAGVINQNFLFNKQDFVLKTPFFEDFSYVSEKFCSKKYVEEILLTKQNYSFLISKI